MEKEIYKIDEFFNKYHLIVTSSLDFYCLREIYIDSKNNNNHSGYFFIAHPKGLEYEVDEFKIFIDKGEIYAEKV